MLMLLNYVVQIIDNLIRLLRNKGIADDEIRSAILHSQPTSDLINEQEQGNVEKPMEEQMICDADAVDSVVLQI